MKINTANATFFNFISSVFLPLLPISEKVLDVTRKSTPIVLMIQPLQNFTFSNKSDNDSYVLHRFRITPRRRLGLLFTFLILASTLPKLMKSIFGVGEKRSISPFFRLESQFISRLLFVIQLLLQVTALCAQTQHSSPLANAKTPSA